MDTMIKQIQIIERMDQRIRMRATGNPDEFALRMDMSKTKIYRMIRIMKKLHAPVEYDITEQSYVYANEVGFTFGFFIKEEHEAELGISL